MAWDTNSCTVQAKGLPSKKKRKNLRGVERWQY